MFTAVTDPKSIAIIGASEDTSRPGGKVTYNILHHGFKGGLWAINPKHESIMGIPTFKSIRDLPKTPELAIIAIPAPAVSKAIKDLSELGTQAVIVLSGGFGEASREGSLEEQRILDIANEAGMTLIGPNCMGVLTPTYAGVFAGPIPRLQKGCIDVISGSGATADFIAELAIMRGLPLTSVFTVGNAVQVAVEDVVEMMDQSYGPESGKVKVLYMETVKKPEKLLIHARSLAAKGCSIVAVKAGDTEFGSRAAASHTGAMTTNDMAVQALFDKAGIIRVRSRRELVDVAGILLSVGPLDGRNVCVLTDAGGPGVMLTDELARQGLKVPMLLDHTQEKLREVLHRGSSVINPVDCLSTRTPEQIQQAIRIISEMERDRIDIISVIMGDPGMGSARQMYQTIKDAAATSPIPILLTLPSPMTSVDAIREFSNPGGLYFPDEVDLARALGKVIARPKISQTVEELGGYDKKGIAELLTHARIPKGLLPPNAAASLLTKAGLSVPSQMVVENMTDLIDACETVRFPLAMKATGPVHKTDIGGVILGVDTLDRALQAYRQLMSIPGVSGVLVQQMVHGTELIVGFTRYENIGAVVMFGLGGVFTEVVHDVQFGLAPLSRDECLKMVDSIRGRRVLDGARGNEPVDIPTLVDWIVRVGRIACDFSQIAELELNPLKGHGSELYVVDARIVLA